MSKNAKDSKTPARPKKSSRVKANTTDVKEIGKDQLDAELWPDTSRYGRFGSFFQASNPELPWLTQYYINIGNGPGAKANSLAIPTTVPSTVDAVRKTARFIWDRHHVDDGSWGALTLQDLKRELWAHARMEKFRNNVNRWADNTIQWANAIPQGNGAAFIADGFRAAINGLTGALGTSVTDVGHDDWKVKAYNIVDDWDKKEAEYMREGKYGRREDGSFKGDGWLGPLEITMPDGSRGTATEYSIGVNINGKDMDIPSLVPTLTPQEVEMMKDDIVPNGKPVPKEITGKAVEFARSRIGKGQSVWAPDTVEASRAAEIRQAAKGGESDPGGEVTGSADSVNSEPATDTPVTSGPRIVINPSTFRNRKDALRVAYNEAFRIVMELNGFDPVSRPTERQRRFFADTAYSWNESMLRRTILARICTFDTSVDDPTNEQLEEAVEFLDSVMEIGAPRTAEEQANVKRIRDILVATRSAPSPLDLSAKI